MRDLLELLLEKAKAAHYHWTVNNPQMTQIQAMAELGDAIQEVEALKPDYTRFDVFDGLSWRGKSEFGDLQKLEVWLGRKEKNTRPFIGVEVKTLTQHPEKYGFDQILRRINGWYYIRAHFVMGYEPWVMFFGAIQEMNKKLNDAILEHADAQKEKTPKTK